jgi:hypothetical protein
MEVPSCQQHVQDVLHSKRPHALYAAIRAKLGGIEIKCCDCSKLDGIASSFARAYFSAPHLEDTSSAERPLVTLCANRLRDGAEVREALTHELVHAFDHCVARRDLTRAESLACSEVRAAREAECRDNFGGGPRELCKLLGVDPMANRKKGHAGANAGPAAGAGGDAAAPPGPLKRDLTLDVCEWFKRRCAMRYAIKSVDAVFPSEGARAVRAVVHECFADHHPFSDFAEVPVPPPEQGVPVSGVPVAGVHGAPVTTSSAPPAVLARSVSEGRANSA